MVWHGEGLWGQGVSCVGVVTHDSGHADQQLGPMGGGQLPHRGAKRFLLSVSFPLLPWAPPARRICFQRCEWSAGGFMFASLCEKRREQYLIQREVF